MNALELDFMLDVAETVANSALKRKESRGSHTRTDFPKRDDENFLKHTLAYRTPGWTEESNTCQSPLPAGNRRSESISRLPKRLICFADFAYG